MLGLCIYSSVVVALLHFIINVVNNVGFSSDVLFDQFLCADSHSYILLLKAQFTTINIINGAVGLIFIQHSFK